MALEIFHHPDDGDYVIVNDHALSMKMEDGRWEPAVLYTRVHRGPTGQWQYEGPNHFVTTKERWNDRFTPTGETTAYKRA
jgi:hypothetical protein